VLAGLAAVGASESQSASGLLIICVAQGVLAIVLSAVYRIPLKFAWSTPGAALLVATAGVTGRFAEAVTAFIVAAALIVLVGLWPALERLIGRIPRPVSNAMLAGILFPLCLAPVQAAVQIPLLAVPVILVWLVLYRLAPRWAVPAAIVLAGILLAVTVDSGWLRGAKLLPQLDFVAPKFDLMVVVSLAIPLFIVTMAGQNIPGAAILNNFGYRAPVRAALIGSGALSGVGALFWPGGASGQEQAVGRPGGGGRHLRRARAARRCCHRVRGGIAADPHRGCRRVGAIERAHWRGHRRRRGAGTSTRRHRDLPRHGIRNRHRRHRIGLLGPARRGRRDALAGMAATPVEDRRRVASAYVSRTRTVAEDDCGAAMQKRVSARRVLLRNCWRQGAVSR
jgi:hypothetical protein